MKIGIFGGTFDPPHFGHLMIAEEVLNICGLDEIWFMPSPNPPHKKGVHITPSEHRIEMVRKAIEDNDRFILSLIEYERDGPSFTYDTMKTMVGTYPDHRFFFLAGADMIEDLPHWHRADELVRLVTFVGVGRPGFSLHSRYAEFIRQVDVPGFEVSASFLRKRFKEKGNTRYFLPDNVRNYIEEKGLYG